MSAMAIFYVAIGVFCLMIIGLYMSVREFVRASAEPSRIKGSIGQKAVNNDSWKRFRRSYEEEGCLWRLKLLSDF